ncbi:tetratricopeptide repeat protein [Sphingobium chlorophenolicum]|uniref:Sel1 domain protein repeat-containing protein n=1 Tax=Sphingobium chlorophenolicum TaxID=46429 RepID=A0A081RC21_SPHCR|nr:tetratricopeptide repeat protein [Sphingobium chlorophenolicum]KEQ52744.1 Sel1 domain protein repeat-containing protein [Sphingobium chlorophenolicum]
MWRRSREWGPERQGAGALAAVGFPCPRWALFFCLLLVPLPCPAGPFEDAAAAYRRGDYADAMRLYQSLADDGDPRAQNSLGRMYLRGQGASRDYKAAMKWFRRAAALGVADAQYNLGEIYLREFGVDQDLVEAARWYTRAAEQGHVGAQFTLAVLYMIGQGVSRSPLKAVYWFERAASQGSAEAQVQLGIIYGAGQGVARDSVVAYKWFALGQANAREPKLRAKASQNIGRLSRGMTPAQIAEAQRQVREWQPVPARGGQS